jgi:MFS family permease
VRASADRTIVLQCMIAFGNTFAIGAFTVLIPEIGRSEGLSDFVLGAVTAAFGLARLLTDIPAGLFITHHLRRAVWIAPITLTLGIVTLCLANAPWMFVAGRFLLGMGHSLGMLAAITLIVRHARPGRQGLSLNAFEMSGMLGVLGGIVLVGVLPRDWSWSTLFLVAASPQFLAACLARLLLASIPPDAASAPQQSLRESPQPAAERRHDREAGPLARLFQPLVLLGCAAGFVIAFSWSAVGTFLLPLRADRDFGLDRQGVAMLTAIPQLVDAMVLLPFGLLADRVRRTRLLGAALCLMAIAVLAIAIGPYLAAWAGAILLGVSLAAWMLPISLVNRDSRANEIAWRTGFYRTCVDSGIFLGPLISGYFIGRMSGWVLGPLIATALLLVGALLLRTRR